MLNQIMETAQSGWDSLKNLVSGAYQGIVETMQSPFSKIESLWNRGANDKTSLEQLREKQFTKVNESFDNPDYNYQTLTKEITQDTKTWINNIFDEEIKALGKPPVKFSIATLGSLAREESGPVTDLEIALLMDKETVEAQQYFQELSQRVSDRLFLLGEHPDIGGKGMRMDEADNAPPHRKFFARNASYGQLRQLTNDAVQNRDWDKIPFEGSRPFMTTPEQFADFTEKRYPNTQLSRSSKDKLQKSLFKDAYKKEAAKRKVKPGSSADKALKQEISFYVDQMMRPYTSREIRIAESAGRQLGRNTEFLYGSQEVYNRFDKRRNQILDKKNSNGLTERQKIAVECMQNDISSILAEQKELFLESKVGSKIDIKRELYRFVEQMITNIGFYENSTKQNTIDIVNELVSQDKLPKDLGDELLDYINFSNKMRLKQQTVLKRQGFATYIDQEAFDEDKLELETKIQGLEQSIAYQKQNNVTDLQIAKAERDLGKLKVKLDHLEDMAPGKILSKEDESQIKEKYVPMLSKFFKVAQDWTQEVTQRAAANKQHTQAAMPSTQKPNQQNNRRRNRQHRPRALTPAFANHRKAKPGTRRPRRQRPHAARPRMHPKLARQMHASPAA